MSTLTFHITRFARAVARTLKTTLVADAADYPDLGATPALALADADGDDTDG